MKSTYLLGALACGLRVDARQAPAEGVAARQWGEGGGGGWGEGGWGEGGWGSGGWGSGGSGSGGSGGSGGSTCTWTDHCLGDPCDTEIDCDGDLTCRAGKCASAGATLTVGVPTRTLRTSIRTTTVYVTAKPTVPANPKCEWTGHCTGDPCETENDCDGDLICRSGKCAATGTAPTTIVTTRRPTTIITTRRPTTTNTDRGTTVAPPTTRSTVRPQPTTTKKPSTPSCGDSPLACIGASCQADADCGFSLIICKEGVCGL